MTSGLRSQERAGFPGTEVTNGRKLLCGCWELNLDSLQKQTVLLTNEPDTDFLITQQSNAIMLVRIILRFFFITYLFSIWGVDMQCDNRASFRIVRAMQRNTVSKNLKITIRGTC